MYKQLFTAVPPEIYKKQEMYKVQAYIVQAKDGTWFINRPSPPIGLTGVFNSYAEAEQATKLFFGL